MARLHILGEGKTEREFAREILRPRLLDSGVHVTESDLGGLSSGDWPRIRGELLRLLGSRGYVTTMLDLYRIPKNIPGYPTLSGIVGGVKKAIHVEGSLSADIDNGLFIPYVQAHEFEALILADAAKLVGAYPNRSAEIGRLMDGLPAGVAPEEIDDGPETHPSRRIQDRIPDYDKSFAGILTVMDIGLPQLRSRCSHFDTWLRKLERL